MNKSNRQIVTLFWVIGITMGILGQDVITRKKKDPPPVQTLEYQLTKKAENGDVEAMVQLGEHYEKNHTYQKAMFWYIMAANNRNPYAMKKTGDLFWYGRAGQKDISMALDWYTKAIEIDSTIYQKMDDFLMVKIGEVYEWGKEVNQDYEKAVKWFQKAANMGNLEAIKNLAHSYLLGKGVDQSYEKSLYWYLKAAELGDGDAMTSIGLAYEEGRGVEKNFNEALRWYQKAADKDDKVAFNRIGKLYQSIENFTEALDWYQKAIEKGNIDAMYNLGDLYFEGKGVIQDQELALTWYWKAIEKGHHIYQTIHRGGDYYSNKGMLNEAIKWYTLLPQKQGMYKLEFLNAVKDENIKFIDLGLPSKNLWANSNIGTSDPYEYGNYYSVSNLPDTLGKGYIKELGGKWKIPSCSEVDELIKYCEIKELEANNKKYIKVIGPNGNSMILPASGYLDKNNEWKEEQNRFWITDNFLIGHQCPSYVSICENDIKNRKYLYYGEACPIRPVWKSGSNIPLTFKSKDLEN